MPEHDVEDIQVLDTQRLVLGLRKLLGLTQTEFGSLMGGRSLQIVAHWEAGRRKPLAETVREMHTLMNAHGLSLDEVYEAAGAPRRPPGPRPRRPIEAVMAEVDPVGLRRRALIDFIRFCPESRIDEVYARVLGVDDA